MNCFLSNPFSRVWSVPNLLGFVAAMTLLACDDKGKSASSESVAAAAVATSSGTPGPSTSANPAGGSGTAPSAAGSTGTAGAATTGGKAAGDETWKGKFTSQPGTMYIPRDADVPNSKDWDTVKFKGDDAEVGRGEGSLSLRIKKETGEVLGEGSGSIGEVILYGRFRDNKFGATVARKNGNDGGLVGTASGKIDGSSLKGSMRLSNGNAAVVRVVDFALTREP